MELLASQYSAIGLLAASSEYVLDTVDGFGRSAQVHSQLVCKENRPVPSRPTHRGSGGLARIGQRATSQAAAVESGMVVYGVVSVSC